MFGGQVPRRWFRGDYLGVKAGRAWDLACFQVLADAVQDDGFAISLAGLFDLAFRRSPVNGLRDVVSAAERLDFAKIEIVHLVEEHCLFVGLQ